MPDSIQFEHGGFRWSAAWALNEAQTGWLVLLRVLGSKPPWPSPRVYREARERAKAILPEPGTG